MTSWAIPLVGAIVLRRVEPSDAPKNGSLASPISRPPHSPNPPAPIAGVNAIMFANHAFGLGRSAQAYLRMFWESGLETRVKKITVGMPDFKGALSRESGGCEYATTLVFVNPDHFFDVEGYIPETSRLSGKVVGCWFWELEDVPESWLPVLDHVDAIMVASDFVLDAFRKITRKPVFKVPIPLEVSEPIDNSGENSRFRVLTSMDFYSSMQRKNPIAVVSAFQAAFPAGEPGVELVIKTSSAADHPVEFKKLMDATKGDDRITVCDGLLGSDELENLYRSCSVYMSLHRSEGFGLVMAECMALGKPVIATNWSGNLEFMDNENSYLIDYALVPVGRNEYQHKEKAVWAEPDIERAAAVLRDLALNPVQGLDMGRRAQVSIKYRLGADAVWKQFVDGYEMAFASQRGATQ